MKFNDLKDKEENELQEMLEDAKIKLGQLRFELAGKSLKDSSQIKKIKTNIAQILTAINEVSKN